MASTKKIEIFPARFGFFPYVFLIYTILPGVYIAHERMLKLVAGYILLGIFLFSYRQLYFLIRKKGFSLWLAIQISVIFILSLFYNFNILFMGFFPAHFIGYYANKQSFFKALSLFAVTLIVPFIYHWETLSFRSLLYFIPFLIIMLVSPFGIRSMERRMELEQQLDEANKQIKELVKREERVRIARDLHDTLGHTLSLLTLKSQLIGKLAVKSPELVRGEAKQMEEISRSALRQVRELVSDMRSITIPEELAESKAILEAARIDCHIDALSVEYEQISPLTQNIVSLCLKEAVTNVVKHSNASSCHVKLKREAGKLKLKVTDDGKGFPAEGQAFGNGLKGMKERLEIIEGNLQLSTNSGTTLFIEIPIVVKD
ncbi:sensor histidine kinase [Niallia taxi]|mgnify:CR=1 FL=1|uniref:sensor histidine kinase n=1 Tax=Niallia taxi TaxID=2499688 RepID=UPI0021A81008|nr:sensor histidine kinase [Niallia taxi]MCT2346630.1 sensor histidine kinase [Niallia taxi]MDE5053993.1 sensor histidine kinase [Niallia taxi]MED3963997.1 sensor histidine kinase [Niallia taxi]